MSTTVQPKIFKKYEIIEASGHHGGGWKVAYADFMTAMMAFFLLMWILASADEQKLRGIAEYFTSATLPGGTGVLDGATLGPPGVLTASNGTIVARGAELGKIDDPTPVQWEVRDVSNTSAVQNKTTGSSEGLHEAPPSGDSAAGAGSKTTSDAEPNTAKDNTETGNAVNASNIAGEAAVESQVESIRSEDDGRFEAIQQELKQAMQETPELKAIAENVIFEQTPEGLEIQIIDQDGKPMFKSGQAKITNAFQSLLGHLGQNLADMPNDIVLEGHTDAVPFAANAGYDNWDLSADRANATRRALKVANVQDNRFQRVSGFADTKPLVPEDPLNDSNRRISILVRYQDGVSDHAFVKRDDPAPTQEKATEPSEPSERKMTKSTEEQLERVAYNLRSALR